uniref:Hint domain-containing protein n=1 Tax=Falsirhodobacter sp. alg1 TaxID=1472418 RepID=UPI00178CEACB
FDSSEVTYTATSDAYNDYLSFSSLYATAEAAQASFCFTAGTSILTQDGLRSVEDLKVGDMVMTRDHGAQPLIWVGKTETIGVGPLCPRRDRGRCIWQHQRPDGFATAPHADRG